jgi:hypothetical protein
MQVCRARHAALVGRMRRRNRARHRRLDPAGTEPRRQGLELAVDRLIGVLSEIRHASTLHRRRHLHHALTHPPTGARRLHHLGGQDERVGTEILPHGPKGFFHCFPAISL